MGSDNLFPPGGFASRRVRLGRLAKHEYVEAIAECDVHHQVPNQLASPALHLDSAAAQCGLTIIEEHLPGASIGRLDVSRGAILVDPVKIARVFRPGTFLVGVVRSTVAHELGHYRLHRAQLQLGIRNLEQEQQARVYASAFLLPRARLEVDATLLRLQERAGVGEVPEFTLWASLQVVANRFGVTRSLVVERLVKLGFLTRHGRRITVK